MLAIREAVVEDADAMAAVNAAGWRVGYRGIIPGEALERIPEAQWRREMREGLRSPRGDSFTRIAELRGEFAGYCFVAAPGREEPEHSRLAELVALYVDPQRWGMGVGTALLERALADAGALGYAEIFLWTLEHNRRAMRLYGRAEFTADGARRPLVPVGAPTVRMRRRLG